MVVILLVQKSYDAFLRWKKKLLHYDVGPCPKFALSVPRGRRRGKTERSHVVVHSGENTYSASPHEQAGASSSLLAKGGNGVRCVST